MPRGCRLPLRAYQTAAVNEANIRNIICVLPTNSGKTIIAAALTEQVVLSENEAAGAAGKVIFLAPTRALAEQQAQVLLDQIEILKSELDEEADSDDFRWRLRLIVGGRFGEGNTARSLRQAQVAIMTPAKFEDALVHGHLQMQDVALLIIDEAHHTRGNAHYATMMRYFYRTCDAVRRPRILALTASPVENAATKRPDVVTFEEDLKHLECDLDAAAWSHDVPDDLCPHALPQVLLHEPNLAPGAGMDSELEAFVMDALRHAKPIFYEATRVLGSATEATKLCAAWDSCIDKITKVCRDLGAWAFDRAARIFCCDLDRGTKALHWYDKPEDDQPEEVNRSVGGTAAHAKLLQVARRKLIERLATRPEASPLATTGKVQALLEYLRNKQPRKCLIFTQQRMCCRLLVELLSTELAHASGRDPWSVEWVCRSGPVGISQGRGSLKYGEARFQATVSSFRDDLRLLVSTSVLEEGINVPDCDAVVNFDGATTSRGLQQRSGRARAKHAVYTHLVAKDEPEKLDEYDNMRAWNALSKQVFASGVKRPSPPPPPSAEEALRAIEGDPKLACVRTRRALLPLGRCEALLHRVYKVEIAVRAGDAPCELDATHDGSHFTKKGNASNFDVTERVSPHGKTYTCALTLPGVKLCNAVVGQSLPLTLPDTIDHSKKSDAKAHAALEGVRYLYGIGVLDEHLMVSGRAEEIAKLREAAGGGRRRSSRSNKYMLHVKEPVVRELPEILRMPPAADAAGTISIWCHPLIVNGVSTDMALLLHMPCPALVREVLVGSKTGKRHQCSLEAGYELTLTALEVRQLSRVQVGWFDLLQAGNSGEQLHPSFEAPQQLLEFEHRAGTFRSAPIAFDTKPKDGLARPQHAAADEERMAASNNNTFPEASKWRRFDREVSQEPYGQVVERLAAHIKNIVECLKKSKSFDAADAAGNAPVVVTLDLDNTLWKGECKEWPVDSFQRYAEPAAAEAGGLPSPRKVYDKKNGEFLELYAEVPLVFDALRWAGVPIAIASASPAADSARALLSAFGLMNEGDPSLAALQMGEDEDARDGRKVVHIQRLAAQLNLPEDRFLLFDDGPSNVEKVREVLHCSALLVAPSVGLTAEVLLRGLEHRLNEVRMRARHEEAEQREHNPETRRKMKQTGMDRLAQGQAGVDQGRADAQLAKMQVPPAWWLVAPLIPQTGASGHEAIDWELAHSAVELFGTAAWPSLEQLDDPLVATSVTGGAGALLPGPVKLCALATYATERNRRHDFLFDVKVEQNMEVSGEVASRTLHAAAAAARRRVGADGSYHTKESERQAHFKPANVQLVPLRSSQHRGVKLIRRLVWRLEHLIRISEPDVAALLHPLQGLSPPIDKPPTVPLALLSAALTHKGASAEAVRLASALPMAFNLFLHDERGCCNWETLEWWGDAILRFFSVAHVLVQDNGSQSFAHLSPAAEAILANLPLHRQGTNERISPQRAVVYDLKLSLRFPVSAAKLHSFPALTLCTPFVSRASLPKLRKQLCSVKDQADPMESLLGAIALAAIESTPSAEPLCTALKAAFGFFSSSILPPPPSLPLASASVSRFSSLTAMLAELVDHFERVNPGQNHSGPNGSAVPERTARLQRKLNDTKPGGPQISFEAVQTMLRECCTWNKGAVFERAEFLGDGFLQVAVSYELTRRHPEKDPGEFTTMRKALVNNLHLGRLLTRRFGVEVALSFFEGSALEGKPAKLAAIRKFIKEVPMGEEMLDVNEALAILEQAEADGDKAKLAVEVTLAEATADAAESTADVTAAGVTSPYDRRGEDHRKPVGDQYEAIVGLVLCALKGDVEATWRCFCADFFPTEEAMAAEEEEETLSDALAVARKRNARKHLREHIDGAGGSNRPPAAPRAAATTASMPSALGSAPALSEAKRAREEEDLHVCKRASPPGVPVDESEPMDDDDTFGSFSIHSTVVVAPPPVPAPVVAPPVAVAPSLPATLATQNGAPVVDAKGTVINQVRQRTRLEIEQFLEETFTATSPPAAPCFAYQLRHRPTDKILAQSSGHTTEKAAKNEAYICMLQSTAFLELMQDGASGHGTQATMSSKAPTKR